jgi:hypothetical protein
MPQAFRLGLDVGGDERIKSHNSRIAEARLLRPDALSVYLAGR